MFLMTSAEIYLNFLVSSVLQTSITIQLSLTMMITFVFFIQKVSFQGPFYDDVINRNDLDLCSNIEFKILA